jgi:hypothetical protein
MKNVHEVFTLAPWEAKIRNALFDALGDVGFGDRFATILKKASLFP